MLRKALIPLLALAALALPAQALAAPKPKVQFSAPAYAAAETDGSATITVVRPRNGHSSVRLGLGVSVDYSTADGTAKAGVDYTPTSGTLNFPACGSSPATHDPCLEQTFAVPVIDNFVADGPRSLTLKLSNPRTDTTNRRAILGYPSVATLVIADDDAAGVGSGSTFQMLLATDYVSEAGPTARAFVVRSGALSSGAAVHYATRDLGAKAGTDYTAQSGTLNFPARSTDPTGSILQEVDIPLLHNPATTPQLADLSVDLDIPSGTGGSLTDPSSERIVIVNSDGTPTAVWAKPSYDTSESAGTAGLLAIAAGAIPTNGEFDVDYATAAGSAKPGVNYVDQSDTLQFFAGDIAEEVDVAILDDGQPGNTAFSVGLGNPVGGVVGTPGTATVNIADSGVRSSTGGASDGQSNTGSTPAAGGTGDQGGSQIVLGARDTACGLVVKASKTQRLVKQKALVLKLRTGKACKVSLAATLKQLRASHKKHHAHTSRALRLKSRTTSLTLQPGNTKTVKVKFTKKTLKAIKKALRARNKKLVATVTVTTRDAASHLTRRTLKITIRR